MKTLLILLLTTSAALATPPCTIVTDGTIKVFEHELAHCNGWHHAPYASGQVPPPEYIHDYPGKLTIMMFGWSTWRLEMHAQANAKIMPMAVTPRYLCEQLWNNRGIPFDQAAVDQKVLLGCQVFD